jgi:hypothetical protein
MKRTVALGFAVALAGAALCAGSARAEDHERPTQPQRPPLRMKSVVSAPSFFNSVLAPRLDRGLNHDSAAALDFTNRAANPWTRDVGAVSRFEKTTIRATTGAMKRYAIDQLGIEGWSLPLVGGSGSGLAALRTDSGGTRLRFGFAHMAPRAEVLVPSTQGRFAVSLDARGRVGASYQANGSDLRIGTAIDPLAHDLTFGLTRRF